MKEDEMGEVCGTHRRNEKYYSILVVKLEENTRKT
jgi:hypothetical protein